jgi:cytochrome P450
MHPRPGGLLLSFTPPEGEHSIPGGIDISVNTWGMIRHEDVFGRDPEMFRPERWLDIEETKYAEMARVVDLTFGSGMFKCLVRGSLLWSE